MEIAYNSVEYDRDYLTIRSFGHEPVEIKVKNIDGYQILSGASSDGSSGLKTLIIRCEAALPQRQRKPIRGALKPIKAYLDMM